MDAFSPAVPSSLIAGNGDLGLVLGTSVTGPGFTFGLGKNDFWGWPGERVIFGCSFYREYCKVPYECYHCCYWLRC